LVTFGALDAVRPLEAGFLWSPAAAGAGPAAAQPTDRCVSRNPLHQPDALEARPEPAWLWDAERCRIVWANRAGLAFWGERTLIDLIERRFDPNAPALRRIAELGRDLGADEERHERFVFHPRTGERALTAACSTLPLDDRRAGVLLVQLAEEALQLADTRGRLLGAAIEALPIPLALFDRHASLLYANAACGDLVAASQDDGAGVLAGWLGDDTRARALIDDAIGLATVSEVESVNTRWGPRAHRVTAIRLQAPVHGRLALLFLFEDVEDRRRAAGRHQPDEAELAAWLDAAVDLTFTVDADLRLDRAGGRLAARLGSDATGLSWREASARLGMNMPRGIEAELEAMRGVRGAVVDLTGGGAGRCALFNARPIPGADGRPAGLRCTLALFGAAGIGSARGGDPAGDVAAPGSGGSDDEATFSAIARAIAEHAAVSETELPFANDDAASATEDAAGGAAAGDERAVQSAAALRIVGGVDHAGRGAAPAVLDAGALEALGEPALIHRAFSVVAVNPRLAALIARSGGPAEIASANLLNLFPGERPQLFALQSRFDDGALAGPGERETITLHAAGARSAALTATAERVLFDNEPAMLMRFAEPDTEARDDTERLPARDLVPARAPARARTVERAAQAATLSDATLELDAAREREDELRAILNSAADGIVTLERDGRIRSFNPSAEAIFARAAADVVGMKLASLLDADSARTVDAYLQSVGERGVNGLCREGREVVAQRADGSSVPLFLTIGPMKVEDGPRFCAVVRDITHWKKSESELIRAKAEAEQASHQKSDFLARMSHELRTPLNAIIGFSEVMSEEKFGPIANDRYKGYLADIHTSGEHLLSLINDLLDLSKIEAGKLELNFGSVDLAPLIQQCVQLMQPQASRERVIMRVSSPEGLPPVVADERALRQILLNLLSNAIKFTPPGGQVIVSTMLDEAGPLQIRIRDTGRGMTGEELKLALEPFRRISIADAKADIPGTGLGLPLTKALAEANRAELRLESTPGAGTLAQIIFPPERVLAG
jgi:PAS domain S-box-containing protein